VLVVVIVVALLVTGGGLLSLALQGRMQGIRAGSEMKARSAADAGLTAALA
jgi:hypothetical protein